MRNYRELVSKILFFDDCLDGAVGESVDGDRLQQEPSLDEAVGVGCFFGRRGLRQGRPGNLNRGGGGGGNRQKRSAGKKGECRYVMFAERTGDTGRNDVRVIQPLAHPRSASKLLRDVGCFH